MFVYPKTVAQYIPGISGCYGPRLYVPYKASEDVHKVLSAMSVWGGHTGEIKEEISYPKEIRIPYADIHSMIKGNYHDDFIEALVNYLDNKYPDLIDYEDDYEDNDTSIILKNLVWEDAENKGKFYVYEFTQETFDSPLFKQILLRYNICWEV